MTTDPKDREEILAGKWNKKAAEKEKYKGSIKVGAQFREQYPFMAHLIDRFFYWYHRMSLGFYDDAIVIMSHGHFSRDQLLKKYVNYGEEIPFFGATKPFKRRHYRDWMTIDKPRYFDLKGLNDLKLIDFYCGGYIPQYNTLFIKDFARGTVEFDYVFYGNDDSEEDYIKPRDYDTPVHPDKPDWHVWHYKYFMLFEFEGDDLLKDLNNEAKVQTDKTISLRKKRFYYLSLAYDISMFFWVEVFKFPIVRLNPKGRLRLWWDQARDAYNDDWKDEDVTAHGSFMQYTTYGMFMIPQIDRFAEIYFDRIWLKCHLMLLVLATVVVLDQMLASYGWYTLFKDYASFTRLRYGFFSYYNLFMSGIFAIGSVTENRWYIYMLPDDAAYRYHMVKFVKYRLKVVGMLLWKKLWKKVYLREAWIEFYFFLTSLAGFHQMWYNEYAHQYLAREVRWTWYTLRRLDVIFFQVHLDFFDYFNTIDYFRPSYATNALGKYWIFDDRAKNYWRKADNNPLGWDVLFIRAQKKSRAFLNIYMRPENFTTSFATWPFVPPFTQDGVFDYQIGFQDPATPIMEGIIDLHHDLFFFFVVIGGLVFWLLFRIVAVFSWEGYVVPENFYRNITHNTTAEVVWTILPALVLVIIATPSFSLLYAMEDIIKPSITVKVIGNQWYWSYEYFARAFFEEADDLTTHSENYNELLEETTLKPVEKIFDSYMVETNDLELGELRLLEVDNRVILPTFTHVRFLITASDVLHSFAVPALGIKLDACPGRLNQTTAFITRQGLFYGQCSEICGINHAFMPIVIEAVDKGTMLGWLLK